jgi:hypothetical protein
MILCPATPQRAFHRSTDAASSSPRASVNAVRELNREHPFLFAQLQTSNDGTIIIGSGGRGSCELCHLNSPQGLAINQGYSTLAGAMLFWALLASGQITMRKVDGW